MKTLIERLCEFEKSLPIALKDENVYKVVTEKINNCIETLKSLDYDYILQDLENIIINFLKEYNERKITDFIILIDIAIDHLTDENKPDDYYDPEGKYYKLRLSEIPNFFLIGRYNADAF